MGKARIGAGWIAGWLLFGGSVSSASAAPTPAQILGFKPRQEGVVISTPSVQEHDSCKVELVKGASRGSGWLLRDPRGQPLRRFFDSNADNQIDIWSYYLNGVEVYREIDSNFNGKPDQYRWLNAGGMKWGVDLNEDGRIDAWKMISVEEVSQELLLALTRNDLARFQALLLTETELKALDLPAAEANRIRESLSQAPAKFQSAAAALAGARDKARWVHLDTVSPICVPAETSGARQDYVKHQQATVLYELNGKTEGIQTGQILQYGMAWRLIEGPVPGQPEISPHPMDTVSGTNVVAELQPLLEELRKVDEAQPRGGDLFGPNREVATYNLKRADVLEKIAAKVKPEEREQWIRQIADCLSAAAQASLPTEGAAYDRLVQYVETVVKSHPGTNLAAYVTFREMSADYSRKLSGARDGGDFNKIQEGWLDRLKKFVQDYPKAEDTPDALLQIGMVSEFIGKEAEAKKWYDHLASNFPSHPLAAKAKGAIRRLDIEGKPLELASPVLGSGTAFDIGQLKGKVVVVYYWASWNQQCVGDFAKLKLLLNTYGSKGLEVVCVNLDGSAAEALSFLQRSPAPGVQLFKEGGLDSPLARDYGIMVLPNLFLVGRDGKVVSNKVQMGNLEEEIKKLLQ
ncbi:MAG: thioredoxin-like domain-containing protein [Gemmataceae bacterium]|nr:thioredoxin-like domain-containing protein [Gemmataceae bacterium]MDW8265772.1 thioredoxin-like domain-containing protein [Gemmataceae bacterium]